MADEFSHFDLTAPVEDEYWEILEKAVSALEESWARSSNVNLLELIPDTKSNVRNRILRELIMLDQERRWSQDEKVRIEVYLDQLPFLKNHEHIVWQLLQNEFQIRNSMHDEPKGEELQKRFPDLSNSKIEALFRNANRESVATRFSISMPSIDSITSREAFESSTGCAELALPRGTRIGRYEVLSVLGRGGMGIVYLAQDDQLDRLVAVKLLHPWILGEDNDQPLLLRDAKTAAKLKHSAILPIYDFGQTNHGAHFFVMEYVEGGSLEEALASRDFDADDTVQIVSQVADALDEVHRAGFVHHDIKPANILLDRDGKVRITDFGLAVPVKESRPDEFSGTVPYMAPEQFLKTASTDQRTDIWALGVVFYEMLTGKRPFVGGEIEELTRSIQVDAPELPSELNGAVPEGVSRVCMKCLSKDPDLRYSTGSEIVGELRDLATESIQMPKSTNPSRRRLLLVSAVVIIVAVGTWVWLERDSLEWWRGQDPLIQKSIDQVEDLTHPILRNRCKLVAHFDSTTTIDTNRIKESGTQFLEILGDWIQTKTRINSGFVTLDTASLKWLDVDDKNWVAWVAPTKIKYQTSRPNDNGRDAAGEIDSRSTSIGPDPEWIAMSFELYFAVSQDGLFQVGTRSPDRRYHLMVLSATNGIANYLAEKPTLKSKARYLPQAVYGEPLDDALETNAKQTVLAYLLSEIYKGLHSMGYVQNVSEAPSNNSSIHACEFDLKNYFSDPISVIHGRIYHNKLRDVEGLDFPQPALLEEVKEIFAVKNERWSPLTREIDARDFIFNRKPWDKGAWQHSETLDARQEYAKLKVETDFRLPEDITSVLHFRAGCDNRNSAYVAIRGLTPLPRESDLREVSNKGDTDDSVHRTKVIIDPIRNELKGYSYNVAACEAFLFDTSFKQIEIGGLLHWSSVSPLYRYVAFGDMRSCVGQSISEAKIYRVKEFDPEQPEDPQLRPVWEDDASRHIETCPPRTIEPQVWFIRSDAAVR